MNTVLELAGKSKIAYNYWTDTVSFCGANVHTGLPISIIFNEPRQPFKRILTYNRLMGKYMHSIDAGLTWTPYDTVDSEFIWNNVDLFLGKDKTSE